MVYTRFDDFDRYLTVARQLDDSAKLGEIVADFDVPRGIVVDGRVVEAGTGQPIISAPRSSCHVQWPGPLQTGYVYYYPLAANTALRGSPTGLYFAGFSSNKINYYAVAEIDPNGHFRLAVPPGPGVILVKSQPGLPNSGELFPIYTESTGIHQLFPYATLAGRAKDDGGPEGDAESFAGFTGPITLARYHAYRVINPPSDAKTLDLTLTVPRRQVASSALSAQTAFRSARCKSLVWRRRPGGRRLPLTTRMRKSSA